MKSVLKDILKVASVTLDCLKSAIMRQHTTIADAYNAMDFDNNKLIDAEEFCKTLAEQFKIDARDAHILFDQIDADGDGSITLQEFTHALLRESLRNFERDLRRRFSSLPHALKLLKID